MRTAAALFLPLVLLIAACGGDDDDGPARVTPTVPGQSTSNATAVSDRGSATPTLPTTPTATPTPAPLTREPATATTPPQPSTPTPPTAVPPTSPAASTPVAPADVRANRIMCITTPCDFAHVTWSDRSSNETGFRVYAKWLYCGGTASELFSFGQVAANVEEYQVPPQVVIAIVCETQIGVAAFNERGESSIVWAAPFR